LLPVQRFKDLIVNGLHKSEILNVGAILIWKGPMYINVLVGAIEKHDMNGKSTAT
jgi:hypothetical protein